MKKNALLPTLGLALAIAVTSALPAAAAQRTSAVTATSPDRSVYAGAAAVLRGTVTPATSRPVRIERLDGNKWVLAKTVRSDTKGRYSTTVSSTTVRSVKYRATVAATSSYKADSSWSLTYTFAGKGWSSHGSFLFDDQVRWDDCDPVTYRINPRNASTTAVAELKTAVSRVAAQSGIAFRYLGSTTDVPASGRPNPAGTDIVVAFVRPGQSYLTGDARGAAGMGGAGAESDGTGYQLHEGFVVINTEALSDLAGGFGSGPVYGWQGTRGQLFMHEVGHAVGMGHAAYRDAAKPQVMYPVLTRKTAVWGAGDATVLKTLGEGGCATPDQRAVRRAAVLPRVVMR